MFAFLFIIINIILNLPNNFSQTLNKYKNKIDSISKLSGTRRAGISTFKGVRVIIFRSGDKMKQNVPKPVYRY